MYNEMVRFPGGVIGIALNLETDEVGCVVLGDVSQLKEGDPVETTGKEKLAAVHPYGKSTPTLGRNRSFFDEIFGNLGVVGSGGLPGAGNGGPGQ